MSSRPDNAGSSLWHFDLISGLSGSAIFLIVFGVVTVLSGAGWLLYSFFFQQPVQGGNPDPAGADGDDDGGAAAVARELELVSTGQRSFGEVVEQQQLGSGVSSDCSICLETFVGTETVFVFPGCQHVFHLACVVDWVVRRPRTGPLSHPLCRRTVEVAAAATRVVVFKRII